MSDDFPVRLRRMMEERDISQRSLSKSAGLNETAVRDILNGKSKEPRLATVIKIAQALGVHVEELASEADRERFRLEMLRSGLKNPSEYAVNLHWEITGKKPPAGVYDSIPVNWRRTNLSGANLTGASLQGADLRFADLRNSNLTRANFSGADLRGASFAGAVVSGAIFSGADLREADFSNVDLREAVFEEAAQIGDIPNSDA